MRHGEHTTITIERGDAARINRAKKICWFVTLWVAGVGGTMLLTLPFKLLIRFGAGMH